MPVPVEPSFVRQATTLTTAWGVWMTGTADAKGVVAGAAANAGGAFTPGGGCHRGMERMALVGWDTGAAFANGDGGV